MLREKIYRKKYCFFCRENIFPDYKNTETLKRFITERSKIMNRTRTGVCATHQRKLSTAIKRARLLALLPFTPKI